MTGQIPLVDYLVLDDEIRTSSRRNAQTAGPDFSIGAMPAPVASASEFKTVAVPTEGRSGHSPS